MTQKSKVTTIYNKKQTIPVLEKDLGISMDTLKFLPNAIREKAQKSVVELRKRDDERVSSGEYVWVDIVPEIGAPYSVLRHISKIPKTK